MRASTSASQASGSTPLSFVVMISVIINAARSAPRSEPAKSHDFLPSAKPLSARSAALLLRQMRPSLRKQAKRSQRLSRYPWAWRQKPSATSGDVPRQARLSDQPGGGALCSCRTRRRSLAARPLMERSMSNSASMRFTASSAIREMGGACLPRLAFAAMSASSKNWRLACAQHSAEATAPFSRPGS